MKQRELYEKLVLKIKTVTPVHIASGSFLIENRDYYLGDRAVRRIHYPSLVNSISEENLEQTLQQIRAEGIRSLLPKPPKKPKRAKIEEDWKQVLRTKVGLTAPEPSLEEEPVADNQRSLLDEAEIYQQPATFGKSHIGNKVQEMALDSFLRSFFPGSTLKGAIRTAFYIDTILQEPQRLDRLRFTWTSNPVEADYPLDREMSGLDRYAMGKDIFRQLCVRDSNYLAPVDSLQIFQIKIMNVISNDGNRIMWKKGATHNVSGFEDADPVYWEMLKPETEFTTEIIVDYALQKLMEAQSCKMEKPALQLKSGNIISALNSFGQRIAEQELQYAQLYKIDYLQTFYNDLQQKCAQAQQNGRQAYFPVGSGVPWHAKTVGSLLESSSLDTIRRHFYRYMGKFVHVTCKASFHGMRLRRGQCPKCGKQIRSDKLVCVSPFPKTRHLIFLDGKPALPPGWICIEQA